MKLSKFYEIEFHLIVNGGLVFVYRDLIFSSLQGWTSEIVVTIYNDIVKDHYKFPSNDYIDNMIKKNEEKCSKIVST